MARKDLPYLPLYVQDFLTDEKLMECSATSTGVYVRIMCVLHKSLPYGKILLKQKDKQTNDQIKNFALKLAKYLPYDLVVVVEALKELLSEDVLQIEGDYLVQKRMVNDGILSLKRSESGRKGGLSQNYFAKAKIEAKVEANSDIDIDNVIIINNTEIAPEMFKIFKSKNPKYPHDKQKDFTSCLSMAYKIADSKGWEQKDVLTSKKADVLKSWEKIVVFCAADKWFSKRALSDLNNEWQRIIQSMNGKFSGDHPVKEVFSPIKKESQVNFDKYKKNLSGV